MLSPDRSTFFLNIPKNASTYFTNLLKAHNWSHHNIIENPEQIQRTIAIIRDPLERWISGFATFAALRLLGYGYGSDHFVNDYNHLSQKLIFDQISFDDHTMSQSNYLKFLDNYEINYFRCNSGTINELGYFCKTSFDASLSLDKNSSESNYDTKQISQFVKKQIQAYPELKAKIMLHYIDDYELISRINFYGN